MRVLLTGGAGYIGSHTAVSLLEAGHDVIVLDNLSNSSPESLRRVQRITGHEVPLIIGDCTRQEDLEKAFQCGGRIDAVIHFAGLKAVGESVSMPLDYYSNNLDATFSLLRVMKKNGCGAIVFSSSATVYGTNETMPLREDFPTGCTNPYGWTKWMNERVLTDCAHADPELRVVILRYFNPVGAHPSGEIGEDPNGIPNNLMPYVCQFASGKLKTFTVNGNDYPTRDGTCIRDFIHVCDLAEGHVSALAYAAEHRGAEVFNLGTGNGYSVLEIVHAFEKANGLELPFRFGPRRAGDIAVCYANPEKAERVLHWHAKRGLEEMCRDAWHWQTKNPNGFRGAQ